MPIITSISRATFLRKLLCPGLILGGLVATPISNTVAAEFDRKDDEEKENLKRLTEKYKKRHSDPAGQVRPDLLRKGMEHAQQMPVARSVGGRGTPVAPPR
jgi:hypothetical protein